MVSVPANFRGIGLMVLATAAFVTNDSFLKLATDGLPPFEALFLRGVMSCIWCLPLVVFTNNTKRMRDALDGWVLLRNFFELLAVSCFIVALANMPIADITAINQTAPMILVLGTTIIFKDQIGPRRLVLIGLGFIGALLVAQPGGSAFTLFALLGFACAAGTACRDIVGRKVPSAVPALVVTYSTILVVTLGAGAAHFLFETWVMPTVHHWFVLAGAGLFLTFGHLFIFLSYRAGATGVVAPFYYMFAVWAVISGWLVFGELPNPLAMLGILLILGSGVAVAILDQRKRRLTVTA